MPVKVHFLNCGTMHPHLAGLFAPCLDRSPAICMLLETGDRLVLVDTGFGTADMADTGRLGHGDLLLNTQPDPEQPAVRQIERLGFRSEDVRDIICTHLDRDHAGGLSDFPDAHVHVLPAERDAALNPRTARERERYRECHFSHGPRWVTHEVVPSEKWFGLDCISGVPGLPSEVVIVPLPGHTRGHTGVAVDAADRWILHCGDTYYVKEELRQRGGPPVGVRGFRRLAHMDFREAMRRVDELKKLIREHGDEVTLIATHDQYEYRNLFGRPLD